MRELVASTRKGKQMIALIDLDESRGGLTLRQIREQLLNAESHYEQWGFPSDAPLSQELYDHLFSDEPIEWNRLGAFQDVSRTTNLRALLCV